MERLDKVDGKRPVQLLWKVTSLWVIYLQFCVKALVSYTSKNRDYGHFTSLISFLSFDAPNLTMVSYLRKALDVIL